MAMNI